MGFNKLMIKKVYAYINPKSTEYAIQFMSKNINNIYQHEFFPNNDNKCFYCGEEQKYHINYINDKKEKNNKLKLEGQILEGDLGDNIQISEQMKKILNEKGKKATCKILSKNE